MGNSDDKEDARLTLSIVPMLIWPIILKVMLLAKHEWQEVLNYQELSSHPSLPLDVQESQYMMMIAVCLLREWSSRAAAKDLQAYRLCILVASLNNGKTMHSAHNLLAAHCCC